MPGIIQTKHIVLIPCISDVKLQENSTGSVRLEDVFFAYPTRPAVSVMNGISLTVPEGKTVALVGPSGYGKSTVMSLLLRFYDSHQGAIRMDNIPMKKVQFSCLYGESIVMKLVLNVLP